MLAGIFLFIILYPLRIQLIGQLNLEETLMDGYVQLSIGYKSRGIRINIFPNRTISFGSYQKPILLKPLGKKFDKFYYNQSKKSFSFLNNIMSFFREKKISVIRKSVFKTIRWEELKIEGQLGLPNPMQTGMIWGYIQALKGIIQPKKLTILLEPVFTPELKTDIQGNVQFYLSPIMTSWQVALAYIKFSK